MHNVKCGHSSAFRSYSKGLRLLCCWWTAGPESRRRVDTMRAERERSAVLTGMAEDRCAAVWCQRLFRDRAEESAGCADLRGIKGKMNSLTWQALP